MHLTRKPYRYSLLTCALALALPAVAFADGSARDTPVSEQKQQLDEANLPAAVIDFIAYVQEFDARYPDSGAVDVEQVLSAEGETFATLYCKAIGIDGPCAPNQDSDVGGFVPVGGSAGGIAARVEDPQVWWEWLIYNDGQVGVIPDTASCPSSYMFTQIYMDDENSNNGNSRGGWIGATDSTSNTNWRHCKLSRAASWQFRPLANSGAQYDYAVLNMGVFCPPGAYRVTRYQDNQGGANNNASTGNVFPSVNVLNRNWLTFTCYFRGGANAIGGQMTSFPEIGMKYGVYASQYLPASLALQTGRVRQDDEDYANTNFWVNLPSNSLVFMDTVNTLRYLARVK